MIYSDSIDYPIEELNLPKNSEFVYLSPLSR